jgi:polysaccharide chain length determinant protein (PEP-CTERM system associated)
MTAPAPTLPGLISALLRAAWRRRYLICVPIVVMIPLGVLGSRMAPRVYEAKTILVLQETSKENPFLTEYAIGLNVKDRIAALTSLLGSEHILLSVLKELGEVRDGENPAKTAMKIRELSGAITLKLTGTDLLELRLKGAHPEGMGRRLDAVTKHFLMQLLSPEQSRLQATQSFLREQMDKRREEMEAAENGVADFKRVNAELLPDVYDRNIQRLQSLEADVNARQIELAGARAQFETMRGQLASANPIIGKLEERIVEVTAELTALRSRYADGHSEIQGAQRRLKRLQEERQSLLDAMKGVDEADIDALWRLATTSGSALAVPGEGGKEKQVPLLVSQLLRLQDAKSKVATLEQQIGKLQEAIAALRHYALAFAPIEQKRKDLEARAAKSRAVYEALQLRYDNATTSLALGVFEAPERIKVIDPAADPTVPVSLPSFVFLIAAIFSGIALGAGLAVLAELFDQRLRSPAQFIALTQLPVLVRLPKVTMIPA